MCRDDVSQSVHTVSSCSCYRREHLLTISSGWRSTWVTTLKQQDSVSVYLYSCDQSPHTWVLFTHMQDYLHLTHAHTHSELTTSAVRLHSLTLLEYSMLDQQYSCTHTHISHMLSPFIHSSLIHSHYESRCCCSLSLAAHCCLLLALTNCGTLHELTHSLDQTV